MNEFLIPVSGSFSLAQSKNFLRGFTPAAGSSKEEGDALDLAFRLDGTFAPVAVRLHQEGKTRVHGTVYGKADCQIAGQQVARMLGLDVDGKGFDQLGKRDPMIGKLLREFPGFRPVAFASPYEAAVWGILAQRVSMKQAAALRMAISQELGDAVSIEGKKMWTFPSPAQLLAQKSFGKIPAEKWTRLHVVAQAAKDGILDADHLRSKTPEEAIFELGKLRGVGSWTAGHILLRGTGAVDLIALHEPRVAAAIEHVYGKRMSHEDLLRVAKGWSPYRTWAMVLAVLALGRSGNWHVATRKTNTAKTKSAKTKSAKTKTAKTKTAKTKTAKTKTAKAKPAKAKTAKTKPAKTKPAKTKRR